MRARHEIKALAQEGIRGQRRTAILLYFLLQVVTYISVGIDLAIEWTLGFGLLYWVVYCIGMFIIWIATINQSGESVKIYQRQTACAGTVFSGFKVNFGRKLGGALWMFLWLFLWGLIAVPAIVIGLVFVGIAAWTTGTVGGPVFLFVILALAAFIPMIIRMLAYSQMYYILASHPEVQATEALRLSKRMTKGHKGKVLLMGLSFIGWILLMTVPVAILGGVLGVLDVLGGFALDFSSTIVTTLLALVTVIIYIPFLGPYMQTAYAGLFVELRDNAIAEGVIMREEFGVIPEEEQVMEPNRYRADGEGYGSGLGVGIED